MDDEYYKKYRARRVWVCEKCEHYIYLNKKNGCPHCDLKRVENQNDLTYEFDNYVQNNKQWGATKRKWGIYKIYGAKTKNQRSKILPKKDDNNLRFVCISDTHLRHREVDIPKCDFLIHTGDVTNCGRTKVLKDFDEWIGQLLEEKVVEKKVLFVPGNHDITLHSEFADKHWWRYFEKKKDNYVLKNVVTLRDEKFEYDGLRIYGMPWCKKHNGWGFMSENLKEKCERIPEETDILLTHNPPAGKRDNGYGIGELLHRIQKIKPMLNIFGHIHRTYGIDKSSRDTIFINASISNSGSSKSVNSPIVFDLQPII